MSYGSNYGEDFYWFKFISHSTTLISVPIYSITFFALLFRCPKFFSTYRPLLLRHTVTNVLTEFLMSVLWLPKIYLPWTIVCTVGAGRENGTAVYLAYNVLNSVNTISIVMLYMYRMNAVLCREYENAKKWFYIPTKIFFLQCILIIITAPFAYRGLHDQDEYKMKRYQEDPRIGEYVFYDNCFIQNLDDFNYMLFTTIGGTTVPHASFLILSIATVAMLSLEAAKAHMSAKTLAIQQNFLYSLFIQSAVHAIFMAAPIGIYFGSFVITFPTWWSDVFNFLYVIDVQHGSMSTLALLITNKPLFKAVKGILSIDEGVFSKPVAYIRKVLKLDDGSLFDRTVTTTNNSSLMLI